MHLNVHNIYAQTDRSASMSVLNMMASTEFIRTDSGLIFKRKLTNSCKSYIYEYSFIPKLINALSIPAAAVNPIIFNQPKLITVHGNIAYDFFYRSKTDNPFGQNDLQQHTEKVSLDITIKEKYPLKVAFSIRQSNSPFFKNFADINIHFDPYSYRISLKQQLIDKLSKALSNAKDIKSIEALIADKEKQISELKNWIQSPATLQKIIEEREILYTQQQKIQLSSLPLSITNFQFNSRNNFNNKFLSAPSLPKQNLDTANKLFALFFHLQQQKIDSLINNIKVLLQRGESLKNAAQKNIAIANQQIYKARDAKELIKIASDNGIDLRKEDKFSKGLGAVRSFSIGRSFVNYTELTAQDITLTGVNIEYNPSYYLAFAAGKINYQFRDFYNKNVKTGGQYLILGRIGTGNPDKRALILTIFKGQKTAAENLVNSNANSSIGIIGYSVESIFKKDENTAVSFEVAKSTKPQNDNLQGNKQIGALWAFSDQSNLGINIKAKAAITETNTKLSGFYRKTGQNFQSFSLFSYNTNQTAWLARVDQDLFKSKIILTGMLRRNDFTNPFTEKTYKTSTVFKSFILNVRLPKYPVLSIGYFPGTQLFIIDKETVKENAYYLLNGSLSYNYFFRKLKMNSLLVYNRYFNKATDSGFVLYKGISYFGMQTFYIKKLQLQVGFAYNSQAGIKYTTTEGSCDFSISQSLKLGVGAKYNKVAGGLKYWGEKAQLMLDVNGIGKLQFQYEKSYLPTIAHSLFPIEIGRISWYKYF